MLMNFKKGKAEGTLRYRTVRGGYHDAADYDRRPTHIPIAHNLCRVYEMNPEAFIDKQFVIPESGNGIPDVLDEGGYLFGNAWKLHGIVKDWLRTPPQIQTPEARGHGF